MILNFQNWNELNEANIFSAIGDWFQTTFGTSFGRIKELLDEYRDLETKFIDEWEEVHMEIDKLDLQRDQTKSDPAEQKKIQRLLTRNRDLLTSMEKVHEKNIDYLMKRVKKSIGEEQKLRNYWELNKSKIDSEVAEEMYQRSKRLADERLSDSLYRKYKDAVLKAKQKDQDFREKYGELARKEFRAEPTMKDSKLGITDSSVDLYSSMSLADFSKMAQNLSPKEAKVLVSSLIKERNDLYLRLEIEREGLNKEIDKGAVTREEAAKRIKSIRALYMDRIRELRSKITVARKYA